MNGRPPRSQQGSRPTAATDNGDDDQDIYEEDDEDGATPGPGYYFNPDQMTNFKKPVPNPNQYFGSTVERFQDQQAKTKIPPNLGPGSYHKEVLQNKSSKPAAVPFSSSNLRFSNSRTLQQPGPGQYD
jgi:hypothetical protein